MPDVGRKHSNRLDNLIRNEILFTHITSFFASVDMSCSKTIHNSFYIFDNAKLLDTAASKVNIRIINEGEVGVSSITLMTDSGRVTLRGAKPKDTTRYYAIYPLFKKPFYEIQVVKHSFFRGTIAEATRCCEYMSVDSTKFTSGYYSLYIRVPKQNERIPVGRFYIGRDR